MKTFTVVYYGEPIGVAHNVQNETNLMNKCKQIISDHLVLDEWEEVISGVYLEGNMRNDLELHATALTNRKTNHELKLIDTKIY